VSHWVEAGLRIGASVAFVVSLAGLAATLNVPPGLIWTGAAVLTGGAAIWLWRRWMDRWEVSQEQKKRQPDYPTQSADEPQY
jgi:membrane protein implicated in regulation of membrane protease activity